LRIITPQREGYSFWSLSKTPPYSTNQPEKISQKIERIAKHIEKLPDYSKNCVLTKNNPRFYTTEPTNPYNNKMKVFYTPTHKEHDPPFEGYDGDGLLPAFEKAERAEIVRAALVKTTWAEIHSPSDFGLDPILAVHSAPYLEYLRSAYNEWLPFSPVEGLAFIPGTYGIDFEQIRSLQGNEQWGFFLMDTTVPISPGTFKTAHQAANCALSSAQALTHGERAVFSLNRPPGHHAGKEICGGYCYLNNIAIAAQWLGQFGNVAILDIDYHAGNGTQEIFYENYRVLTISLHADPTFEYPTYSGFTKEKGAGAGYGFHHNFPLPAGTNAPHYLNTLDESLELIDQFRPNYLLVSAGMDTYKEEPLGSFKLTQEDLHAIGQHIAGLGLPTLIIMEGGYYLPALGENFIAFLEPFH